MRRFGLYLAVFATTLSLTAPAQADVVTLVCSSPSTSYTDTLYIDLEGQTVCDLPSASRPPCSRFSATVTEQYITFGQNMIERTTAIIHFADGSTGTCQRADKPLL